MANLGDDLDKIEGLADRDFKVFGYSLSVTQLGMALAAISSLLGTLYAGFVMYQKVESIANLDLDAYQQQMDVMDAKVEESLSYARDIKNGLRDDILRIEKQTDRVEDMVRNSEEKVRTLIDAAEVRFESKREQLRMSQQADLKELEDKLTKRVQLALDNPLSGN